MEVFTIPFAVASEWLQGRIGETELRQAAGTSPEVIFIMHLDSLTDYRAVLDRAAAFYRAGARAVCARTKNPVVLSHMLKLAGRVTLTEKFQDGTIHSRLICLPDGVARWVRNFRG